MACSVWYGSSVNREGVFTDMRPVNASVNKAKNPPMGNALIYLLERSIAVTCRHVDHPATEVFFSPCIHAFHDPNYSQHSQDSIAMLVMEGSFNLKKNWDGDVLG